MVALGVLSGLFAVIVVSSIAVVLRRRTRAKRTRTACSSSRTPGRVHGNTARPTPR
jgi:hypothetical protein